MAGISILTRFGEFVANAAVPQAARVAARDAVLDTVGVALAGAAEPAAVRVRDVVSAEGGTSRCSVPVSYTHLTLPTIYSV